MASDEDCEQVRKIFVGGLNRITDDESLSNFFLPWGVIVDHTVMRDAQGISRGFGFVTFENSEPVDNLMKAKRKGQKFRLDETDVEIKRAFPKSSGSYPGEKLRDAVNRTRKLFVGGIPSTTTENDLRQYFEKYGIVSEVEILYDKVTARMRGFAFVTFEDEDAADKVCQVRDHKIKMKSCEVKKAESRSSIKLRQERQGPPAGNGGPRGGGFQQFNQGGGGNMGNSGSMPAIGGGGNSDLSGLTNGIAALQALGLTGSILQNLVSSGAVNQGQLQNAIGGLQGNRQGNFSNQQGGFGGNFGGNSGGGMGPSGNVGSGGNNPLALLGMLGNMGGQLGNLGNLGNLNNLGNLSSLLNLAGLASLASGSNQMGNQAPNAGATSENSEQYRQTQYSGTNPQTSTGYGGTSTNPTDESSYGYAYGYNNMGSYNQQQSGYGPMKFQSPNTGNATDKKNYRPY